MGWKKWVGPIALAVVAVGLIYLCANVAKGMRTSHMGHGVLQEDVGVGLDLAEHCVRFALLLAAFVLIAIGALHGVRESSSRSAAARIGLGLAILLGLVIMAEPAAWGAPVALLGLIAGACTYGVLTRETAPEE